MYNPLMDSLVVYQVLMVIITFYRIRIKKKLHLIHSATHSFEMNVPHFSII